MRSGSIQSLYAEEVRQSLGQALRSREIQLEKLNFYSHDVNQGLLVFSQVSGTKKFFWP